MVVDLVGERFRDVPAHELGVASLQGAEVREGEDGEPRRHRRAGGPRLGARVVGERGARALVILAGEPRASGWVHRLLPVGGANPRGGAHLRRRVGDQGVIQAAYLGRRERRVGSRRRQHLFARPAVGRGSKNGLDLFWIPRERWLGGVGGRGGGADGGRNGAHLRPGRRTYSAMSHLTPLRRRSISTLAPPARGACVSLGVAKTSFQPMRAEPFPVTVCSW